MGSACASSLIPANICHQNPLPAFLAAEAQAAPPAAACPPAAVILASPWLQGLNPAQVAAVIHSGSPLLVQAGPGTGKTRTLTHRVAHLLHHGFKPQQILAVTFTRQAAGEMTQRLDQLLGKDIPVNDLTIKTFHALGAQILQSQGACRRRVADEEERRPLLLEAARTSAPTPEPWTCSSAAVNKKCFIPPIYLLICPGCRLTRLMKTCWRTITCWDFDDLVAQAVLGLRLQPQGSCRLAAAFCRHSRG